MGVTPGNARSSLGRHHVERPRLLTAVAVALATVGLAVVSMALHVRADSLREREATLAGIRALAGEVDVGALLARSVAAGARGGVTAERDAAASELRARLLTAGPEIRRSGEAFLDAVRQDEATPDDADPLASRTRASRLQLAAVLERAERAAASEASAASATARLATAAMIGVLGLALAGLALVSRRRRDVDPPGESDVLTGLPDHRTFDRRVASAVEEAMRRGTDVALVIVDVDRLARINERSGRSAADDVLIEVGRRIAGLARSMDTVARIGGDEFAWLLPGADTIRAWEAADRARRTVAEALAGRGGVTISCGVCSLSDVHTATELVRCADRALTDAKRRGRDTAACFVPESPPLRHGPAPGSRPAG